MDKLYSLIIPVRKGLLLCPHFPATRLRHREGVVAAEGDRATDRCSGVSAKASGSGAWVHCGGQSAALQFVTRCHECGACVQRAWPHQPGGSGWSSTEESLFWSPASLLRCPVDSPRAFSDWGFNGDVRDGGAWDGAFSE